MTYNIVWFPRAETSYLEILEYLDQNFGYQQVGKFDHQVEHILDTLARMPQMYMYSNQYECHLCQISKITRLYYRVNQEQKEVELLLFWDSRQNPENLNLS
jgi:plasmid stabilization system protein ParE